jgi:hypothetical protein
MRHISIEEAKRNRDEKIEKAQGLLADAVGRLQSGEDWKAMLAKLARGGRFSLRRLSFRNQLLVEIQAPGTTSVASYAAWQRAGRQVRKKERSITILAPVIVDKSKKTKDRDDPEDDGRKTVLVGFRPIATFAGSQTDPLPGEEGRTLPEPQPLTRNIEAEEAFKGSVEILRDVALRLGDEVVTAVELRPRGRRDSGVTRGWFDRRTREIVVITGECSRAQIFKTLVHEIAHAILHGNEDHHARSEMEVEAESVAFVVCKILGLDTSSYSFSYVSLWAGHEKAETMVLQSGQRIVRATNVILDALIGASDRLEDSVKGAA